MKLQLNAHHFRRSKSHPQCRGFPHIYYSFTLRLVAGPNRSSSHLFSDEFAKKATALRVGLASRDEMCIFRQVRATVLSSYIFMRKYINI